jgi:D-alanyl-lipoteichoic acid acyltransferase DltB (MBOAT superfamily)
VFLLVGVGGAFAVARLGHGGLPVSSAVWPVLGSMFMFRLIVYMYDVRHQKDKPSLARTLAYFFCLPNVSFLLFPVLDFATFKRTYYDRDAFEIYKQGVHWMVRGLTHLMLYRMIYTYGTILPTDVQTGADFVRYSLANFGLYLRVSGQFHLIVGMLHLFGFRLPETHKFFYAASSFTEFWRRINIYWKDFMTKVFYMPSYFKLKKHGAAFALVVSTLLVFAATWFFHSYQWFWLLGTWLISWTDTLFWGILAVLLCVNALRETNQGRKRTTKSTQWSGRERFRHVINTVFTFTVICLLWTLWSSPTVGDFARLLTAPHWRLLDVALVMGVLGVVAIGAWITQRREHVVAQGKEATSMRTILPAFAALGLVWLLGEPYLRQFYSSDLNAFFRSTRIVELNTLERAQLQRGYYERIVHVNRFNGQLWDIYSRQPKDWLRLDQTDALEKVNDARLFRLKPNHKTILNGITITTNRWGMRDRDYDQAKGPNTTRIAVIGASYVMGIGVPDQQLFEAFLEEQLAADTTGHGTRKIEILNFAVSAYLLQHELAQMESGELQTLGIDVVLITGHLTDASRGANYLFRLLSSGQDVPYDTVKALMNAAGWNAPPTEAEARRTMRNYEAELSRVTFARMGELCRQNGWRCVYAYTPMPFEHTNQSLLLSYASAGGLETLDLGDVYDRYDERKLVITEWDYHPNIKGHHIIADRLQKELVKKSGVLTHQARPVVSDGQTQHNRRQP